MLVSALVRRVVAVALALLATLVPLGPVAAEPPLVIRPPLLAEPGAVPPAVVAGEAALPGTPYAVTDGSGATVLTGTLAPAPGPAAPWSRAALADLSPLGPGSYMVAVEGTTSAAFTVAADAYASVLTSLLGLYDANSDGLEPSSYHAPSHLRDARSRIANGPHRGERVDVAGGWMDAGDQLKFTVTTAYAALMLDLAARQQPTQAAQLRATADTGIRWLRRAHPRRGVFVAQVGHTSADHNAGWRDPTDDDRSGDPRRRTRPSLVLTSRTGGSDVAGMTAAALATAALRSSGGQRRGLLREAKQWLDLGLELDRPWRNCCYQQDDGDDEIALARAALWRATGRASYAVAAARTLDRLTRRGERGWLVAADGYGMAGIAATELCGALGGGPAPERASGPACRVLRGGGANWAWVVEHESAFGQAGPTHWGSVRQSESGALVALLAARAGLAEGTPAALRATGWFLGANPWGVRWQSGLGVRHPYHWAQLGGPGRPLGAVVGGPADLETVNDNRWSGPLSLGAFDTAEAFYADLGDDYVLNEVSLAYNAPAVLHFALLSPS